MSISESLYEEAISNSLDATIHRHEIPHDTQFVEPGTYLTMFAVSFGFASVMISTKPMDIQKAIDATVAETLRHFGSATSPSTKLEPDEFGFSVSVINPTNNQVTRADYHGHQAMYPASVVKLFYLGKVADMLDQKTLSLSPELERGIHNMVVDSNNDATGFILDTITDTTGGPELPPADLKVWMKKRQAVNEWYASKGYSGMNVCQKTWNEGPYGREKQGYGVKNELRNSLTPNVCNALMTDVLLDNFCNPSVSGFMKKVLGRNIPADGPADSQSKNFVGKILPSGSKLYSKAGWVDSERHDVAAIILPNGHKYVFAIFTKMHGTEGALIPFIASRLLHELGESF